MGVSLESILFRQEMLRNPGAASGRVSPGTPRRRVYAIAEGPISVDFSALGGLPARPARCLPRLDFPAPADPKSDCQGGYIVRAIFRTKLGQELSGGTLSSF